MGTLCILRRDGNIMVRCVYMDDMTFTGNNKKCSSSCSIKKFKMTKLEKRPTFLEWRCHNQKKEYSCLKKKHMKKILQKFNISNCNPVATPTKVGTKLRQDSLEIIVNTTLYKSLVGSLHYLTITKPDILFISGLTRKYIEELWQKDSKKILIYVKGNIHQSLLYTHYENPRPIDYIDKNYGGDLDERKSTFGYMFNIRTTTFLW